MKRLSTARLSQLQQLRVLAHPLRLQLLELFAAGPRTARQAAELLGGSPTRLYHHVHALERAGLVVVASRRQVRGTVEKTYRAAAARIELDRGLLARRGQAGAVAASMFDLRADLAAALAGRRGAGHHLAARATLLLDDRQARALRKELIGRLERIQAEQAGGAATAPGRRGGGARRPWSLTVALLPMPPARADGAQEAAVSRPGPRARRPASRSRRRRRRQPPPPRRRGRSRAAPARRRPRGASRA
jgi:DNA-binding transcriptional ArsR family regulator